MEQVTTPFLRSLFGFYPLDIKETQVLAFWLDLGFSTGCKPLIGAYEYRYRYLKIQFTLHQSYCIITIHL